MWVAGLGVGLDAALLVGFLAYRWSTDLLVVVAFALFAVIVAGGEWFYMRSNREEAS